ncbi:MAG TPA: GatB/YqeY domain-containing protein [Pseudonocardiaceae bacterium]
MAELKARLQADLSAAIKEKDSVAMSTLRMALAAITNEEVSGSSARELTDTEVQQVLRREVRKRREAAEAFAAAGREELAAKERAEGEVLERYLPRQLSDTELAELAQQAVDEVAAQIGQAPTQRQMGQVMKVATAKVAGRAEGGRVAAAVKSLLQQS